MGALKVWDGTTWQYVPSAGATVSTTAPASPITGQLWMHALDGELYAWNGSAWINQDTGEWSTTTPTAPLVGVKNFTRFRARRIPAFIGPSGQDTHLQPSFFSNRIAMVSAIDGAATLSAWGVAASVLNNGTTTATAVTAAPTNFYTSMQRVRFASTTTAGTAGELRGSTAQYHLSSTANKGGFFFVARFGINLSSGSSRLFVGFTTATTAMAAGTDPSATLNMIGFGCDSTDGNIQFMRNDGTGTATKIDMGASFAKTSNATNFFEARIFAPSGSGQQVFYSIQRLNDGTVVNSGSTAITTDLPAVDTGLNWHMMLSNGATAAAHSMDIQSVYIETDN